MSAPTAAGVADQCTDTVTASVPADLPASDGGLTELVRLAGEGEQWAWNALVDRFSGTVWAVARGYRLSSADAADVFQTTWLRLVEHLFRIEHPERIRAWLATTARNESLRLLRLGGRQVASGADFDTTPDVSPHRSPEVTLLNDERDAIVSRLLAKLPSRQRLVLRLLSADADLSYRDISESLGMPIGSIGPTRARALEHLKRLAAQEGVDLQEIFA